MELDPELSQAGGYLILGNPKLKRLQEMSSAFWLLIAGMIGEDNGTAER